MKRRERSRGERRERRQEMRRRKSEEREVKYEVMRGRGRKGTRK